MLKESICLNCIYIKPKLYNRVLFMVRQAHHYGHPELVEGKKRQSKIIMRNLD
jgi:hypothetical protein